MQLKKPLPLQAYPWDAIVRRLRLLCSTKLPTGTAVINITVLVKGGQPVAWYEPIYRKVEPKDAMTSFLAMAISEQED